jgi:hypothetical protein
MILSNGSLVHHSFHTPWCFKKILRVLTGYENMVAVCEKTPAAAGMSHVTTLIQNLTPMNANFAPMLHH